MVDLRLTRRHQSLEQAITQHQTAIINRLGLDKAGLVAAERFFNNPRIATSDLLQTATDRCAQASAGLEHVLVVQDTSQYNFDTYPTRFDDQDPDIGYLGDGKSLGLFAHTALAFDARLGWTLGLADLQVYTHDRQGGDKQARDYKNLPVREKHSYRWLQTIHRVAQRLQQAEQLTVIADREADIYELLAERYDARVRLIVRSEHNRRLGGDDRGVCLHQRLAEQPTGQGQYTLNFRADHRRAKRPAELTLRWAKVELLRPARSLAAGRQDYPPQISVWVVEAIEQEPAAGQVPIHWYLYTTHPVDDLNAAIQIVQWYAQRWWIEDFFRLTKSEGFELESSQFTSGMALQRLLHVVFTQAVAVLTLRQGRLAEALPAERAFSPQQIRLLRLLLPSLQGRSVPQQNPFVADSLAWAAWIVARLGGWTARSVADRPAGVITLIRGLRKFYDAYRGYKLSQASSSDNGT